MLNDVADRLRCPVCHSDLAVADASLRCVTGHSFDIARQGYVNLLPGGARPGTADSAAMVRARAEFLAEGHFAVLISAVASAAGLSRGDCVVDAGAGTGDYLAAVLDTEPTAAGLALDVSKDALRRAARRHPRLGAAVCDLWTELPVRSGVADVVLNVFAPRNAAEYRRVLRPGGLLLVVTPTPRHLGELVGPLGLVTVDALKEVRLSAALEPSFTAHGTEIVEFVMTLDRRAAGQVVGMGPSARHLSADALGVRLDGVTWPLEVTASCAITAYRPLG